MEENQIINSNAEGQEPTADTAVATATTNAPAANGKAHHFRLQLHMTILTGQSTRETSLPTKKKKKRSTTKSMKILLYRSLMEN